MQNISWSDSLELGKYKLKNRVVLAALTRCRADPKTGVPNDLHVEYYTQRANGGLLLTEASAWTHRGHGFPGAANIYTKEQAEGWKRVTDAVHAKGTLIYLQIVHAGRATHEKITGL